MRAGAPAGSRWTGGLPPLRPVPWLLCALLALAPPVRAGEEGAPPPPAVSTLTRDLRHDDAARRRDGASALLLRVPDLEPRALAAVEAAVLRAAEREREPEVRATLYAVLGRTAGDEARDFLLGALLREDEPGPQEALSDALGGFATERVAGRLSTLLFSDAPVPARCLAAAAVGRLAGEAPLETLLALAGTTHPWAVEAAVLDALSSRRTVAVVDQVLSRVGDPDPAIHASARTALEALLGLDLGDAPEPWRLAWKGMREGWPPAPADPAEAVLAEGESLSVAERRPEVVTTARFFGIPVTGRRVAFVLDCSQSMWGEKMESARKELLAAVKGLRPGRRFGVVMFNEKVWTWRETLDPATPARKWALAEALRDPTTRSYTNIHDALERAFAWGGKGRLAPPDAPGLDEIFLLSDGEPNRGRVKNPDGIVEAVEGWNVDGTIRLHAVALGDRPADLLRRLAEANGGTFVRQGE